MISDIERAERQRLWTQQLYKEHQDISWFYRIKLAPVIIKVSDIKSAWGQWQAFYRTITINQQLIESYSWDVVVEILKHEMAHQYVSETYPNVDETAHGESFKKACQLLSVAPWAARASADLSEKIPGIRERVISSDDQRLLDKVEKLLSLAQSTNENEAFLAMQKSREICLKHNLDKVARKSPDDSMDSMFLTQKKKRTDPVDAKILSILNDHFAVRVIHTSLFDAERCEKFQAAEILGRRENLLMADHVYHFLRQQCSSLWEAYRASKRISGTSRRSYQLGILTGFDQKLSSSPIVVSKPSDLDETSLSLDTTALQKIETSRLDEFVRNRYPRLSKKSWGGGHIDRGIFNQGQVEGRRLNVHKPLHTHGRFGGFLK